MAITIDLSIEIARPPDDVFAAFTNIPAIPEWARPVKVIRNFSGPPVAVGTTYSQVSIFLAKEYTTKFEITALVPERMVKQKMDGMIPGELTAIFEPIPAGTRLLIRMVANPTAFFGIVDAQLKNNLLKQWNSDLKTLKQKIEATSHV
jgi:uncharacterized protein YndB with AHSA1/START domain